jgi:hypothetical protein
MLHHATYSRYKCLCPLFSWKQLIMIVKNKMQVAMEEKAVMSFLGAQVLSGISVACSITQYV